MSRRTRHLTGVLVALVTVLVTVTGVGSAMGAWSITGSGAGRSAAATLVTPSVTATRSTTAPTSAIDVTWSAPNQLPGATYSVTRNGTPIGCTTSPCADTGLAPGTGYSYVVTAKLQSWTAQSGTATVSTATPAATATSLTVAAPASVTAGSPFTVTVTAKKADGTTDVNYAGTKSLSWSGTATATSPGGTAPTLPTSATFTNGVATLTNAVALTSAGAGRALTASDGSINGSTSVTVNAAASNRLVFNTLKVNGTTQSCSFSCGPFIVGQSGTLETRIELRDLYGNVAVAPAGGVSVSGSRTLNSGQGGTLTPPANTQVAQGASVTSGVWTYTGSGNGNFSETLTFTAQGLSNVAVTVARQ